MFDPSIYQLTPTSAEVSRTAARDYHLLHGSDDVTRSPGPSRPTSQPRRVLSAEGWTARRIAPAPRLKRA